MRAGGVDLSLRDVTMAQMGNGTTECGWRHALKARGGFGVFWKSQLVKLKPASGEDGWLLLARGGFARYGRRTRWGGCADGKARKNVYLSPYVEEPQRK